MKKENIFREKLYNHTLPVSDGLWDAIEAQLPPKKDQRIFPLFWFTLFSATLIGGMMMFGVFNQKPSDTKSPAQSGDVAAYIQPQNKHQESFVKADQASMTNTATEIESINSSANSSTASFGKGAPGAQATPSSKAVNKSSGSKSIAGSFTDADETVSNNQAISIPASLPINQATNQVNTNNATSSAISLLPQQDVYLSLEESALPTVGLVKPDPNCYKFSGTGNKLAFSVDVFGGPGYSPKTYDQNSAESSIYADARKATENNQYAWSAGARFNLQHRSGLTGRIGLNYTQVGDLFDYTDSLATQSTTRIDSFFAADGTFLYTETSQVLILGTLIKKIHNTYRYLDVPLIIGYELPMGRSTIIANAGAVFNLTSSHEGQILDPMLHPRSITEGDPGAIGVYKSSVGVSIYLGAGFLFPLSDDFSGLVEPTFIYRLNPVTLNSYPLQERRHYAGLNLGIRYHIH